MTSRPVWVTLVSALLTLPVVAFSQGLAINPVEDAWGVITSTVTGMTQDRQGFLWLGSINGLYRYDGHNFVTYRHDEEVNTLTFDRIECIATDSAGFIWIAPFGHGLDRLDPITGTFTHYVHDKSDPNSLACDTVGAILTDHTGTIWIGTDAGVDRLDKGSDKFIHHTFDPSNGNSLSCNRVRLLYEDKDSVLWLGTGTVFAQNLKEFKTSGGLNRFDRKTGKFTRYMHDSTNEHSLIDNRVTAIFEDSHGTFWIGTARDGLHTMDRKTGQFTRHPYDPSQPNKLSRPPLRPSFFWAEDFISSITESFDGKIIISTFSNGINVFDRVTERTSWYGSLDNATVKLGDNLFWNAYTTRDKTVWISAWEGYLYRITPEGNPITLHNADSVVLSLLEDKDETLWIGTLHGLVKQEKNGTRTQYLINKASRTFGASLVFPLGLEGSTLTLQTPTGLYTFDTKTSVRSRYLHHEPGNSNSLFSDTIPAMIKTKEGDYFFATLGGLNMLDHKTKKVRGFKHDPDDTTTISHNEVYYVALDRDNNIWTGGKAGVCRFDKATEKFRRYRIGEIVHLLNDSKGRLWASGVDGLFSYDAQRDVFTKYKDPYRVFPPGISAGCALEDTQHNLWIGCSVGLIQIPPDENMRPVVNILDRGTGNLFMNLGIVRRNGNILFGAAQGYYEIEPALFKKTKVSHAITIERFLLNDVPIFPSNDGILTQPIYRTKNISLSHDQNTFAFEFADIDFSGVKSDPAVLYKLEPYDSTWRNVTGGMSAYYFDVKAGSYQFKVRSFDNYGNQSEASLFITIAPPWWKTAWAYVCFAGAVLGTVGMIYASRISTLRKQQAAQIRVMVAIQEDERKRISRDLHDDVGTKLSALKLFLSSLREKVSTHGDPEVDALAKTTEQFIGETMSDVRALLANLSPTVLEEFGYIVAVEGLVNKLNETRQACFKLSVFGMHSRLKPAYELALYRITQELVNNVMKHAAAHSVSLQIGQRDERIILMIEDDGKGFDVGLRTGGYGLKNLMARCKLMHGSMTIDSHLGMGTSVLIEIPYDHQSI